MSDDVEVVFATRNLPKIDLGHHDGVLVEHRSADFRERGLWLEDRR